jgi:hypothetical protein
MLARHHGAGDEHFGGNPRGLVGIGLRPGCQPSQEAVRLVETRHRLLKEPGDQGK